jgi:BirA family biotin operon repressor/biotin-[acetyl-CoA-carboxylase] ligase
MVADMERSFDTAAVPGTRFTDVRRVGETGSTNRDLLKLASEGAPEGVVLMADHQTAGRGRLDRSWSAPPGSSLLVSALIRPALDPAEIFLVTVAAAVAACEACEAVAGVRPGIKWPNDLVITDGGPFEGRKLSGILAESIVHQGRVSAVVLGMGLNVNWPDDLPEELAGIAVSLAQFSPVPVDRDELLSAWLGNFDRWLTRIGSDAGRAELMEVLRSRSATMGRLVRVQMAERIVIGVAEQITGAGHLLVRSDETGELVEITVGDVVHATIQR